MQLLWAFTGLFLGGIISKNIFGALLGFCLGYWLDKNKLSVSTIGHRIEKEQKYIFFYTTFQVMGYLSKVKGRVTETNIQTAILLMNKMNLDDDARLEAQRAFRQGKEASYPLRVRLRKLRSLFRRRQDLLQIFLEIQIGIALSDGCLHPNSRDVLYIIADEFNIDRQQLNYYMRMVETRYSFHSNQKYWQKDDKTNPVNNTLLNNAYNLLNVNARDTPITIKRAYRKLMLQYHPDKLKAQGLPPEMIELATNKTQDIQKAYEIIKYYRKFK